MRRPVVLRYSFVPIMVMAVNFLSGVDMRLVRLRRNTLNEIDQYRN